ncbi:MAG TPA: capsule assembly Wzi family protein [Steroidobacteraceae bacterium]|nr:capsule assembly Wzi family protein [Steroidobacteraceae bacterium]
MAAVKPVSARRTAQRWGLSMALALVAAAPLARADAGWFESGDVQLRLDLQLLNDAEVIRYPVNQWPIPRAAIAHALANSKAHYATNRAVAAALERVRMRLEPPSGGGVAFVAEIRGGQAGLWRDFDTLSRDDAEVTAGARYANGRFAASLRVTGAADPADGDEIRADGSHVTVQLGNWLMSAHTLDRWWGPAHEGGLILSNNARPMPTLMVERVEARPVESRWLHWLGPWRMSFGISQMESSRQDIDSPLFMAWRVVVMPFKDIEVGVSRTAQFCGDQLECNLEVFGNLLVGNDNVGIDATPENEPGNQMAGFDIRWNSPVGNLPYAIYGQYIGEDESSYLPAKFLSQLGLETWKPMGDGGMVQGFIEYASTTCSGNSGRGPYYGCAYNQGLFNVEGYRYKGRTLGYTSDRDAENWAMGASLVAARGAVWTATARISRLNRDDFGDTLNTVASVPTGYRALELGWKGKVLGEKVSVEVGVEAIEPAGGERDTQPYGFIGWRHEFQP